MTNLADLLPAGGGQNNTEFVADGNISAGAPVILTAAGKAAPIVSSGAGFGSEYEFESGITYYSVFNYNTTQDRVVAFYTDMSNGDYPTAVVGSISGSVITWGTPVVIISSAMSDYLAATYDANLDKHLVIFKSSSQGKALMGTVTAATNTISFGATETFSTDNVSNFDCMYDPSTTKSLIVWRDSGSSPASSAVVATPASDSSISFGSVLDWTYGSAYAQDICCAYDTNQNKVVVGAWEIPANYEIANYVATITGTSVTFGSRQQAYSTSSHHGYYNNTAMDYDKSANAIVNFWRESGAGKCIAGTISGDSISYGSATAVGSDTEMQHAIYSDQSSSIALSYFASSTTYLQFFSTSGTTITVGSQITTDSAAWQYNANVYDPDTKAIIVGGTDGGDSSKGKSKVYEQDPTNLTSTNLLGLAPEAISDTATGTINTWGSRCESSSLLADSLSLGSPDTTSGNGQKENVAMAYDSNADRTILVYRDGADSDKVKAIVGTLSGTSTSWGTPVEVLGNTGGAQGICVAYDASAQRVLVGYNDSNNSNYLYLRVGEISGTSVTFGTPLSPASHDSYNPNLSYDTADQKLLLVYANADDSFKPYGAACTITGGTNSVVATTPASVSSRNAYDPFGLAYNANDGKHLLDITDNTSTGYAYVVTMSSGSISVGAEASYSPGFTPRQSICVYDSSAQKIVRGYYSNSDPRPVEFAVASISGTSVSFGTAATAFTTNSGTRFHGTFDSSSNQVGFVSRTNSTNYIETNFGSVSGTTITFGTATSVYSGGTASTNYNIVYDSTAQKLIYAYAGATYDAVVGSFGTTPLTVTSDYYVQTDGTLSTDTGGQLIGNAIKTNQINIKDYTG